MQFLSKRVSEARKLLQKPLRWTWIPWRNPPQTSCFSFCGGSGRTRIVKNLKSLKIYKFITERFYLLSAVRACMNCHNRNHRWIPLRCDAFLGEKPNKQFSFKNPKKRRQQLYFISWRQCKNTIIIKFHWNAKKASVVGKQSVQSAKNTLNAA